MTETILDTLRGAIRCPGQAVSSPSLQQGLNNLGAMSVTRWREGTEQEAKQLENSVDAVSDTISPELEDLSKMFDD